MLRPLIALTVCAFASFSLEARAHAQVQTPGHTASYARTMLQPVGAPTAWVTAKDVANLTLSPGGSGSNTLSCVNKGSVGGVFSPHISNPDPSVEPTWYSGGLLGAGLPYFWFTGTSQIKVFEGQFLSNAYIGSSTYTCYIVMYVYQLGGSGGDVSQNPTPIRFSETGLVVKSPGVAVIHNKIGQFPSDFVSTPVTAGDAKLHVVKMEHAGDLLSLSIDGGVPVSIASGTTYGGLNSRPLLGFDCCSFNTGSFHGAICEWIVYDRQLTALEDAANMHYLRQEWRTP